MSLCNREASVVRLSVCLSVCKLCANRYFYHKHDSIATKLAHDGPQMGLHPGCAQGQGRGQTVKGHVIRALLLCHEMFAIQYLLTFCLYMHSLYEAPLQVSSTSVRQLDVMSTSWNELIRHWRSGLKIGVRVSELQDSEKRPFPLQTFIVLITVYGHYRASLWLGSCIRAFIGAKINDLLWPWSLNGHYALRFKIMSFGAHQENLNRDSTLGGTNVA